jgi:Zn finger protein HypA/HybF involved in hydrogenase expression
MKRMGGSGGKRSVLVYSHRKASQATVARQYKKWREAQGIPPRCDNPMCRFRDEPLVWNHQPLPLILDHAEGNRRDNRPEMLRYLCPNCDSQQLQTRGGANRGRVKSSEHGFVITSRDGRRSYTYFGNVSIRFGGSAEVQFVKAPKAD